MDYLEITNQEDYLRLVKQYSGLVDYELTLVEGYMSEGRRPSDLANYIPKVVSLVNVVGYLRGQDGVFMNTLEVRSGIVSQLYENEDDFERRLSAVMEYVTSDAEAMKFCRAKLMEYYLLHRGITFGEGTRIV